MDIGNRILVIIDGTGSGNDQKYAQDMQNGFMKQIETQTNIVYKKYFRGPGLIDGYTMGLYDSDCVQTVEKVMIWIGEQLTFICGRLAQIAEQVNQNVKQLGQSISVRPPSLYLTGYSRGGAIAIAIAKKIKEIAKNPSEQLKYYLHSIGANPDRKLSIQKRLYNADENWWSQLNQNIKFMALFDAVDRTAAFDTSVIPSNVQVAVHAMRDPKLGSRRSFSNTGTKHELGPNYLITQTFSCTHAAMGGTPWTGDKPTELNEFGRKISCFSSILGSDMVRDEILGDRLGIKVPGISKDLLTENDEKKGSSEVKNWMWSHMRGQGIVG